MPTPAIRRGTFGDRRRSRIAYVLLAVVALGLITTTNRFGAMALRLVSDRVVGLADLCIPSFVACLAAYLAVSPERPFGAPTVSTPWRRVVRLGGTWLAVWLAASAVAALVVGHWIRYTTGASALTAFVLIGPVQEEMLYRGALFELAERGWDPGRLWNPILATTVPFSLQHLQFHGYQPTPAALLQVGFTLPMGLVFGGLRQQSGSLWPGVVAHILTNLVGAIGSGGA